MFTFYRTRTGSAEAFDILVAQNSLPDSNKRFGTALTYTRQDAPFHAIGTLVLIHPGNETTSTAKNNVEVFLAAKQLSEDERTRLIIEIELLTGKSVWKIGREDANGWYLHDELSD